MENEKLTSAKTMATFGIITSLAGITLVFMGQILIGVSGSIVGAGLALKGFKTIKKVKNG